MKKTMILAAIASSVWFTPIVWVVSAWLGVQAMCMQQQCRRSYAPHDEPVEQFTVLVRMPPTDDKGSRVVGVPLAQMGRETATDAAQGERITGAPYGYLIGDPSMCSMASVPILTASSANPEEWGASLMLPAASRATADGWTFSVTPDAAGGQRVALRSGGMDFEYQTDGLTIRPIRSQVMDNATIITATLAGLVVALAFRLAALAWRRRLK